MFERWQWTANWASGGWRGKTPTLLFTDRQRLEQILENLLSNAIKFTEQGEIHGCRCRARRGGHCLYGARFRHWYRPDQQASSKPSARPMAPCNRRYGGTGLVSISVSLATLLGGYISVTSEPGAKQYFHAGVAQYVERDEDAAHQTPRQVVVAPAPAPVKVSPLPVADAKADPTLCRRRERRRSAPLHPWWWKTSRILRAFARPRPRAGLPLPGRPTVPTGSYNLPSSTSPTPRSCWTCACPTIPGADRAAAPQGTRQHAPHPSA